MAASRARILISLIAVLAAASLVAPVHADTKNELKAARARLAAVQQELNRLAAEYADAQSELAETEARIAGARKRVQRLRGRMRAIERDIDRRIREIYVSGGAGTIGVLLGSESFSQFSDRVEFLGQLATTDSDLLARAQVTREELRRHEADLAELSERQQRTMEKLEAEKAAIAEQLAEAKALEEKLARQLERERAAAAAAARAAAERRAAAARVAASGGSGGGGGGLQACPVGTPRAFSNDFGAPRPGGRTHQGIDILAPLGTPIYAAHGGVYQDNSNALGGLGAVVRASNGDYTYYTHMSSRSGVANGSAVSAGTVIGYVGNSGNAAGGPPHLHFEYHPGGGAAANPYNMLVAVC